MTLAREAMEKRGKSKNVALLLFAHEFHMPSIPPRERLNSKTQ
jgi:hypothetical protein